MKLEADAGQRLSFTAGLPVIDRFANVRMVVAVIGPGLPALSDTAQIPSAVRNAIPSGEGAVLFESPEDQSTCNHVMSNEMQSSSEVKNNRCHFHEEYGDTHSWTLIDNNVTAVNKGTYHMAVYTKSMGNAKVWVACCDWPEDFTTQYPMPDNECPFCGTNASFGSWQSHFYEQKSMRPYAGFPPAASCASTPAEVPDKSQCPPTEDKDAPKQNPNCVLGCSNNECHSHNVLGECTYTLEWITPHPKVGYANVTLMRIFAGESIYFTSKGHIWPHNLVDMKTDAHLQSCNFDGTEQIADVGMMRTGHLVKFEKPGTFYYSCQMTGHCALGQVLTVEVKDVSTGMRCHEHELASMEKMEKGCEEGEVMAYILGNAQYGAATDECTQMCTTEMALNWIAGAQKGSCKEAGFGSHVKDDEVQPAGSPMKMKVTIMGKAKSKTTCESGNVLAYMIGSADMGAGADECSEFCTTAMALGFMRGAEEGSCVEKGFGTMVTDKQVQPAGSPQAMKVVIMSKKAASTCHCHSYEAIACGPEGDALYDEHIVEIKQHCAGVVAGTTDVCPYLCYQPFEVLHQYYLECNTRPEDAMYTSVDKTKVCHKAALSSPDKCVSDMAGGNDYPTCGAIKKAYKAQCCKKSMTKKFEYDMSKNQKRRLAEDSDAHKSDLLDNIARLSADPVNGAQFRAELHQMLNQYK